MVNIIRGWRLDEPVWVQNTRWAYAKRLRITNATPLACKMFTRLISEAISSDAYFIWQDNVPVPVSLLSQPDASIVDGVSYCDMSGMCYSGEGELVAPDRLRCLSLSNPPITNQSLVYAYQAQNLDNLLGAVQDITNAPRTYVSGTSETVKIKASKERDPHDIMKFDANDDARTGTPIKPDVANLDQWDNEQNLSRYRTLAYLYMMNTHTPPQDMEVLGTLSATTQSLVSNRESFVSNCSIIKQDVSAVFADLGFTPEYDALFPMSAQDIASVGDAYGKGLDAELLKKYPMG